MCAAVSGLGTPTKVNSLPNQEPTRKSVVSKEVPSDLLSDRIDSSLSSVLKNAESNAELYIQKKSMIEIRYYPLSDHLHLAFDGKHLIVVCGGLDIRNVGKAGRSHIAIQAPLTYQQKEGLQNFIYSSAKEQAIPYDTCAGSSAYILRKYTDLQIPKILASLPASSTAYLLFQKMLGNQKIGEVAFRGYKPVFLAFPAFLSFEMYGSLIVGREFIGTIKNAFLLMNSHLEYSSEHEMGISKDLDSEKIARLQSSLFITIGWWTIVACLMFAYARLFRR